MSFLDLTITINGDGSISTTLYEKPENFYLYLPASSAHPFANLKGLVHGMVYRTLQLRSNIQAQQQELYNLYVRLYSRGYTKTMIKIVIIKGYNTHIMFLGILHSFLISTKFILNYRVLSICSTTGTSSTCSL
jgi:hypothetical protein